jgi:hypothetical protein
LGLEKVAQTLTEQLPTKVEKSLAEQKEKLQRLGVVALSVFGVGVLSFVLYNAFTKLMVRQGPLLAALILLAGIVVLGCGLLSVFLFAKANELKEGPAPRNLEEAPVSETGKLLDAHHPPAFAVTDRTTELLSVENSRRSTEDR